MYHVHCTLVTYSVNILFKIMLEPLPESQKCDYLSHMKNITDLESGTAVFQNQHNPAQARKIKVAS